jgi:ribosomal-protein-alanine N-acetyltransferase
MLDGDENKNGHCQMTETVSEPEVLRPIHLSYRKYYLRTLTSSDVSEKYLRWVRDPEVTKYLDIKNNRYDNIDVLYDYVNTFENVNNKFLFGVFDNKDNAHIGNASVYNIHYRNGTFDIGYLIGEKEYWGKNASVELLVMLLKFSFDDLKLRKFFGGLYANHLQSRFVLRRMGFVQEACLKDYLMFEGKPVDRIIYSLDKYQWAQIRKKFSV